MHGLNPAGISLIAAVAFLLRAAQVRKLWGLPSAGEFLPRFRVCLLIGLFADAPIGAWLAATGRLGMLVAEQWVAMVMTLILYNVVLVHFSRRAALTEAASEPPVSVIQVSMSPRRLRDHSSAHLEVGLGAVLLAALWLVALARETYPWEARRIDSITAWLLYLQLGLLLLKVVFVRWRMPLPLRRTDDFRRWRSVWLNYYLTVFDSLRVMFALLLLSAVLWMTWAESWTVAFGAGWLAVLLAIARYLRGAKGKVDAAAREIRPLELIKEFPKRPVPEGRFVAGGLFYITPGFPGVLVQSSRGIAVNLAEPTTYAWAGYLAGLAAITIWMAR